jgi:hypothetical protein
MFHPEAVATIDLAPERCQIFPVGRHRCRPVIARTGKASHRHVLKRQSRGPMEKCIDSKRRSRKYCDCENTADYESGTAGRLDDL